MRFLSIIFELALHSPPPTPQGYSDCETSPPKSRQPATLVLQSPAPRPPRTARQFYNAPLAKRPRLHRQTHGDRPHTKAASLRPLAAPSRQCLAHSAPVRSSTAAVHARRRARPPRASNSNPPTRPAAPHECPPAARIRETHPPPPARTQQTSQDHQQCARRH